MDEPLNAWFKREVLIHEPSLLQYLRRVWPKQDEVPDLRQEIYVRVYDAARKSRPTEPRAFMFATARHLMADRIRRGRVVSIEAVADPEVLNVLVDELSPERRLNAWQELRRLTHALNSLPPRCREVVWLSKVDELTHRQIAELLGLSVRTVEGQVLKGMRLLSDTVSDTHSAGQTDTTHSGDKEPEHGKQ